MLKAIGFIGLLLAGCSTVDSRRQQAPVFQQSVSTPAKDFEGCFADKTAGQNVAYLPRARGGSFSAKAGPQNYVFWVVDIDDLGAERRIALYAVNSRLARKSALPAILACI
jgi:hypothetical protein